VWLGGGNGSCRPYRARVTLWGVGQSRWIGARALGS
jgi:hypothetical protein